MDWNLNMDAFPAGGYGVGRDAAGRVRPVFRDLLGGFHCVASAARLSGLQGWRR